MSFEAAERPLFTFKVCEQQETGEYKNERKREREREREKGIERPRIYYKYLVIATNVMSL